MRIPHTAALLLAAAALAGAPSARAQSLRGSPASIERMYRQARAHDLTFFRTASGVRGAARDGDLVRMSGNDHYRLAGVSHPYALAITRTFVQRLAEQYHDVCGERLVITSAIRPSLLRLPNSTELTVHPTGMAVDIRRPSGRRCLNWLRERLLYLEGQGVLEATEEHHPPHFHVAVFPGPYRRYIGPDDGGDRRTASGSPGGSSGGARKTSTYRVRTGDSLWKIARRYDVTVDRIRDANDMRGNHIVIGQVLVIPVR
jgi:nucleoid-associated protein YgaU